VSEPRPALPITLGQFFASAGSGILTAVRCTRCGALAVPPKEFCGDCHQRAWEPVALSGEGRITSFTVIRVAPRRFTGEAPYAIAHVTLTEGVALLGRLVDIPFEAIAIGMPVRFRPLALHGSPALGFGPA
jgi:uncharacterized OB-fold protein